MLAMAEALPGNLDGWVVERKYDGIRAIAELNPQAGGGTQVRLWSRLGHDKSAQFPEIVAALGRLGESVRERLILDGEIVVATEVPNAGNAAPGVPRLNAFEALQPRLHLQGSSRVGAAAAHTPVALVLFDFLAVGVQDLRTKPLEQRREQLVALVKHTPVAGLFLSEIIEENRDLLAAAAARGWEGVVAKRKSSVYRSGRRSAEWRKQKLQSRGAFVIGGWAPERGHGQGLGALLVGEPDPALPASGLRYAGRVGSGFGREITRSLLDMLEARRRSTPPFDVPALAARDAIWVQPEVVVEVQFSNRTSAGLMRHPVFLGVRDDKSAKTIAQARVAEKTVARTVAKSRRKPLKSGGKDGETTGDDGHALLAQIDAVEKGSGKGTLVLPEGQRLDVTNLRKVFWPALKLTKGDLLRHYVRVAWLISPVLADRPLVMRRFPDGVEGKAFYQQRAPDVVPPGVRVEMIEGDHEAPRRFIGGDLFTLLYMGQLGCVSQDPWLSRVGSLGDIDAAVIDLDPMPEADFGRVRAVALAVRDELETVGIASFAKTSGASGLHIHVPLTAGTSYEAARLFGQIVATLVVRKLPQVATVERKVNVRGAKQIYVDCLQMIEGKTLASAYCVRANAFAGVSTPVTWDEIEDGAAPEDFTLPTFGSRVSDVGDLWAPVRGTSRVDLRSALVRLQGRHGKAEKPAGTPKKTNPTGRKQSGR